MGGLLGRVSDNMCERSRIGQKGMLNQDLAAVKPSAYLTRSFRAGIAL